MHQQGAPGAADSTQIVQLTGTYEAFGVVVDFLSRIKPFSEFDLGTFSEAIRQQLREGHHLAAMTGAEMVGYAGWLLTSEAIARAWTRDEGKLVRVPSDQATAAALTIVAVTDTAATPRLIRGARELNPGKRAYFKRGTETEPGRVRKTSVLIFSSDKRG